MSSSIYPDLGEGSGKYRTCPGPTIYHLGGGVWEILYLLRADHDLGEGSGKYRTCPGPTIYHLGKGSGKYCTCPMWYRSRRGIKKLVP